jgi:DNA topoisomerase VI subunit B
MTEQTTLNRTAFTVSRALEFFSEDELNKQIGVPRYYWTLALLKELIDNALDACETTAEPHVQVVIEPDALTVIDNGAGLPQDVFERSLDYSIRVTDKMHYISPTRGQMGNALKCLWAAPFVATGGGAVEVHTGQWAALVEISVDRLLGQPNVSVTPLEPIVKTGTFIKIHWPEIAGFLLKRISADFYNAPAMLCRYIVFNPHVRFSYKKLPDELSDDIPSTVEPSNWRKWTASEPTSPHWYSVEALTRLMAAYIVSQPGKTVREFVSEFRGLSGTAKQKQVTEAAGLSGTLLADLVADGEIRQDAAISLLEAMQNAARPVQADSMGIIGGDALKAGLQMWPIDPESFRYHCMKGDDDGLPYAIEVAFALIADDDYAQAILTGLNWTPTLRGLPEVRQALAQCEVDYNSQVAVVVHLITPRWNFTDRGKTTLTLSEGQRASLEQAVKKVTKEWTQLQKRQRRGEQAARRELEEAYKSQRRRQISIKEAAYTVMEQAYLLASSNGSLPANARQIMYAARPLVLELTDGRCWKDSATFTQRYLPDFLAENPEFTAGWDVVYDARGHLTEPHTDYSIGLGTIEVRNYIADWQRSTTLLAQPTLTTAYPTRGPYGRYRFALFVEKEGFDELLTRAQIAERFDLALMSTKGMTVTAYRRLIESLTVQGVTILALHDFDKSGLGILHTMKHSNRRYQYEQQPRVIDLGLRLTDVQEMGLQGEPVFYPANKGTDPIKQLQRYGATEAECAFLVKPYRGGKWEGERVELNAMNSRQFITWLEQKLQTVGVEKVMPDENTLTEAYRRAIMIAAVQQAVNETFAEFDPASVAVPADLDQRVAEILASNPTLSWDAAIQHIIGNNHNGAPE